MLWQRRRLACLALFLTATSFRSFAAESPESSTEQQALPQKAFNKPKKTSTSSAGVKWTSGDNSGEHASAPRSAKYWAEHGLDKNKPNYAKTDAEVFRETYGYDMPTKSRFGGAISLGFKVLICLGALGATLVFLSDSYKTGGGNVLGGGSSAAGEMTEEQREAARQARIARFQGPTSSSADNSKGAYAEAMAQAMGKGVEVD